MLGSLGKKVLAVLRKEKNAMFPRIKSYKNKDGSWRHYLYLVATKRIGGRVKQVVMANFGRLEQADKIIEGTARSMGIEIED